jgi:hypothetical protein
MDDPSKRREDTLFVRFTKKYASHLKLYVKAHTTQFGIPLKL